MEQPLGEQSGERVCSCGHSAAAHHFRVSGRCSFCACQEEATPGAVKADSAPPLLDAPGGQPSGEGYQLLRDGAEQLRAAPEIVVPADHVDVIEKRLPARTASQRAQAASARDLVARLRHRGRLVSDAVLGEPAVVSAAQRAETAAIQHQLDPEASDSRMSPMSATNETGHDDAHPIEQAAVGPILRPRPAAPLQRSV